MEIKKFGVYKTGEETHLITLTNKNGMKAVLTDVGGSLVDLIVPDKNGNPVDVVLGYDTSEEYEHNRNFFGAVIGRNGNRIGNATFTLNGETYKLWHPAVNAHNLHSGPDFFCTRLWNYETEKTEDSESVVFFINSPEGDQGFPGAMDIEVTYTLTEDNELMCDYYGLSDKDTVMNMTNHSFFNLNGHDSGDIRTHIMKLYAEQYTATDADLIPTGELPSVEGTPMDFREGKTIGQDIDSDFEAIRFGGGYDHNFVVNNNEVQENAELIAECIGDKTGIKMEVYSDLPGVQIYTSNGMNQPKGKKGASYGSNAAVCFETQYMPDAVNHPEFPQPFIKAGRESVSLTVFRFTTV